MKNGLLGAATAVVALLALACAVSGCSGRQSPYPIKSSGLLYGGGNLGTATPIYWLDNRRVLFPGYEVIHKTGPDGRDQIASTPPDIYIWDTESGQYTRHADLQAPMWFLCFNQGFIAYSTPDSAKSSEGAYYYRHRVIRAGMLGHESELPRTDPSAVPEQCGNRYMTFDRPGRPYKVVYTLRDGDGYILVATGNDVPGGEIPTHQGEPVKLVRPGQDEPVTLPILAKEMNFSAAVTYSDFAQRYVVVPSTWRSHDMGKAERWPDEPIPIYLIARDGQVDVINIPNLTFGRPMGAYPTRYGIFWTSNNAPSANSIQAGGWLMQDGKVTKLFDHLVNGAGVSPDGCNIAFANDPHRGGSLVVVQAIDLCGGK